MEAALSSVIVERKNRQFLLKMGKNFSTTAENFLMGRSKLFVAILDHLIKSAKCDESKQHQLVVTLKHPEPRVTLLLARQNPLESVEAFE